MNEFAKALQQVRASLDSLGTLLRDGVPQMHGEVTRQMATLLVHQAMRPLARLEGHLSLYYDMEARRLAAKESADV